VRRAAPLHRIDLTGRASAAELDPALRSRIERLNDEGWEIWSRFDTEVRSRDWHPFVAADYGRVVDTLVALRQPGLRFLEWGSATGVITIAADLIGYEAYGIELDPELVDVARELAARFDSAATFAAASFLPTGYVWRPRGGDGRTGTIGAGDSGYPMLQHPLEDFDVVYGFPWPGEEPMMHDLMRRYGGRDARLVLHGGDEGIRVFRHGIRES
jgi:SAM-dependent methyltransferase